MDESGWTTPEDIPFEDLTFEQKTYEYARRWTMSRRALLLRGAAFGGAALAAMTMPGRALMAQQAGGNLIIGRAAGSDTMDPHLAALIASSEVQVNIFDPIALLDPGTGKVYPALAESWEFSNANKSVAFKLRSGVTFHDGTPLDAKAVEFTVKRHLAPETKSRNAFLLGPIDRAEAVDDMTVVYHFKQPYVALWASFFLPYTAPLSPTAAAKHGIDRFGRNPVGTGPFRFVDWDANDVIKLARFDEHVWPSPWYRNNRGPAWIDTAEYRTIPEPSTRIASLLSGEINIIAGSGDAVPADKVKQLEGTEGIKVVAQPALGVHAVVFSHKAGPTDDARVRKAICHALNREKVLAFALNGNGKIATSPLASAFPGFDESAGDSGYGYDPDKARALLAEAGHGGELELTYLGNDGAISRAIGEILQADLASVGVTLKLENLPNAEYGSLRREGRHNVIYLNYSFVEPDILRHLLGKGAPLNFTHADAGRVHELASAQVVEFDPMKREKMLHEMQQITVREAHWLPIVEANITAAMRSEVDVRLNAPGTLILNDVAIGG